MGGGHLMALSNCDTLAFGPDGKSCNGIFKSVRNPGDYLEIYKNWIYVRSYEMWKPNRSFNGSVIAEIHHGAVRLLRFDINAARCDEQGAVFVYASECVYSDKALGEAGFFEAHTRHFGGIGCYGFDKANRWVGVETPTVQDFFEWLRKQDGVSEDWINNCLIAEHLRFNQGDACFAKRLGVETPSTAVGEAESPLLMQAIEGQEKP
jgi:hypothetical protein